MSTLYLDRQVASIEREGASIVIRDREGRRSNLPLHLLDRIVIRGTVGLDTSVLGHLADNGVIRCPPWRAKRRRVVPGSREATRYPTCRRRQRGSQGSIRTRCPVIWEAGV